MFIAEVVLVAAIIMVIVLYVGDVDVVVVADVVADFDFVVRGM